MNVGEKELKIFADVEIKANKKMNINNKGNKMTVDFIKIGKLNIS